MVTLTGEAKMNNPAKALSKLLLVFLIAAIALLVACSKDDGDDGQEDPWQVKWEEFLAYVKQRAQASSFPGASIAVIIEGKLSFSAGVGIKRYGDSDPVTEDTLFRGGSTNKMLVCAAIMRLVEQGLIDVKRPVTDYVPYFDLDPDDPSSVSVWNCMTHTSGIPDYIEIWCDTDDGALSRWFHEHPNFPLWSPPGRLWNYSNLGYSLLGLIAEEMYSAPYKQTMDELIFTPCGMIDVTYDASEAAMRDSATGHIFHGNQVEYWEPDSYDCALAWPPGLLFSSAKDMARFFEMLLADGADVLSPESVREMTMGHVFTRMIPGYYYGYGLMSYDYKGEHVVMHDGGIYGFLTSMWMVPEKDFGVVVMLNTYNHDPGEVAAKALDIFLDLPDTEPPDYSTPPSTWGIYTGDYFDPYEFGRVEVYMDMQNRLWIHFVDRRGWKTQLYQYAADTFYFNYFDAATLTVTFFPYQDSDLAEYAATRAGVAKRVEEGAVTPNMKRYMISGEEFNRHLQDLPRRIRNLEPSRLNALY